MTLQQHAGQQLPTLLKSQVEFSGTPLVLAMLDGLRCDYLNETDMPFLHNLASEGLHVAKVFPSPGYCERVELLTGQVPEQSGFLTAYGFNPEASPFRRIPGLGILHAIESLLPRNGPLRRRVRSRVARLLRAFGMSARPSQIPADFLPFFALTEDAFDHSAYRAFGLPSLMDSVIDSGGTFDSSTFTALGLENGDDETRLRACLAGAREGHRLHLVFIGILDEVGHHAGPDGDEMHQTLSRLDDRLRRFVEDFRTAVPAAGFVFLGADGLVPVVRRIDVEMLLTAHARRAGLRRVDDYLYFLDSTIARVWFRTARARAALAPQFEADPALRDHGILLTEKVARDWRLPWGDRRYGDLLWWASPGTLISPDFFHVGERVVGMHGYDTRCPGQQSTMLYWGPEVRKSQVPSLWLHEVHDLIRASLLSSGGR